MDEINSTDEASEIDLDNEVQCPPIEVGDSVNVEDNDTTNNVYSHDADIKISENSRNENIRIEDTNSKSIRNSQQEISNSNNKEQYKNAFIHSELNKNVSAESDNKCELNGTRKITDNTSYSYDEKNLKNNETLLNSGNEKIFDANDNFENSVEQNIDIQEESCNGDYESCFSESDRYTNLESSEHTNDDDIKNINDSEGVYSNSDEEKVNHSDETEDTKTDELKSETSEDKSEEDHKDVKNRYKGDVFESEQSQAQLENYPNSDTTAEKIDGEVKYESKDYIDNIYKKDIDTNDSNEVNNKLIKNEFLNEDVIEATEDDYMTEYDNSFETIDDESNETIDEVSAKGFDDDIKISSDEVKNGEFQNSENESLSVRSTDNESDIESNEIDKYSVEKDINSKDLKNMTTEQLQVHADRLSDRKIYEQWHYDYANREEQEKRLDKLRKELSEAKEILNLRKNSDDFEATKTFELKILSNEQLEDRLSSLSDQISYEYKNYDHNNVARQEAKVDALKKDFNEVRKVINLRYSANAVGISVSEYERFIEEERYKEINNTDVLKNECKTISKDINNIVENVENDKASVQWNESKTIQLQYFCDKAENFYLSLRNYETRLSNYIANVDIELSKYWYSHDVENSRYQELMNLRVQLQSLAELTQARAYQISEIHRFFWNYYDSIENKDGHTEKYIGLVDREYSDSVCKEKVLELKEMLENGQNFDKNNIRRFSALRSEVRISVVQKINFDCNKIQQNIEMKKNYIESRFVSGNDTFDAKEYNKQLSILKSYESEYIEKMQTLTSVLELLEAADDGLCLGDSGERLWIVENDDGTITCIKKPDQTQEHSRKHTGKFHSSSSIRSSNRLLTEQKFVIGKNFDYLHSKICQFEYDGKQISREDTFGKKGYKLTNAFQATMMKIHANIGFSKGIREEESLGISGKAKIRALEVKNEAFASTPIRDYSLIKNELAFASLDASLSANSSGVSANMNAAGARIESKFANGKFSITCSAFHAGAHAGLSDNELVKFGLNKCDYGVKFQVNSKQMEHNFVLDKKNSDGYNFSLKDNLENRILYNC